MKLATLHIYLEQLKKDLKSVCYIFIVCLEHKHFLVALLHFCGLLRTFLNTLNQTCYITYLFRTAEKSEVSLLHFYGLLRTQTVSSCFATLLLFA